jgi:hypothetical protein
VDWRRHTYELVPFVFYGRAHFRVGEERVKTGVSMQRFEVRILVHA